MKKILLISLLSILSIHAMTGCNNSEQVSNAQSTSRTSTSDVTQKDFDIESARNSIIIKGQPFEIPIALKDLSDGWTFELYPEEEVYLGEGVSFAHIYYEGNEMFIASLEHYAPEQAEESVIYNLTVTTDDCSVDGFIPLQSTKQEILDRYGEPDETDSFQSPFLDSYSYGIIGGYNENGRLNDQSVSFKFTEEGLVKEISITYADLNSYN